ncbi:hypothetical protein EDD17DRAFT_946654 [Pisolithus thermaeus]|nr:hypothetical protein EV401DRAFT_491892 [Pisolithus croceorrhizus]KAI6167554.1 hypothetical protein EDD17DRAFT_946654 [Pisolithus thermaeus]
MHDRSPRKNLASSNHKADDAVIEELTRTTGIESQFLKGFRAGTGNAHSRPQWASPRCPTRPEDIAYSLFGVSGLHLPVSYGKPAANALGRQLAEIISQSGDISVLDWVGETSPFHSCFPAHITSYGALPLPPHQQLDLEEHSSMSGESTSEALQKLNDSLAKLPLPRFLNRRLILPCIAHRVAAVLLKEENQYACGYTYEIQASGLRPLEVTLSDKLENATIAPPGTLRVVRPWHSKLPGPSAGLDTPAAEQVLFMLARPCNAILLTELPRNEFKRIASSAFLVAQPADVTGILESEVGHFDIV